MLRDAQSAIACYVLTRDAGAAAPSAFVAADAIDAADRLSIHRNNVMGSLIEVLADTFEAVARHCGAHNFEAAAGAFIRRQPPARAQLSHFGAGFPAFLDDYAPARRDLPFLADLARLEWALNEAYFAAEAAPLSADRLAALPQTRLGEVHLRLHPATRRVASAHPIYGLWRKEAATAAVPGGGGYVLVVRPDAAVEAVPITAGDHAFLAAIDKGAPLGAAVEAGSDVDDGFDVQTALGNHLVRGTFCGADLPDALPDLPAGHGTQENTEEHPK